MRISMKVMLLESGSKLNKEGEKVLEVCAAMNKVVVNSLYKKRESRQVTCEPGFWKTGVGYCLVSRDQRKFVKVIKVFRGEDCITQTNLLVWERHQG